MPSFVDDMLKAVRNTWLADSTFVGLLGDAEAVYMAEPTELTPTRLVTLQVPSSSPLEITGVERWRCILVANLYGRDPRLLARIFAHLQATYSIPTEHAAPIVGDTVHVTQMTWTQAEERKPTRVRAIDGRRVKQLACTAELLASWAPQN